MAQILTCVAHKPYILTPKQVLVFVHTRKGTANAAKGFLEMAQATGALSLIQPQVIEASTLQPNLLSFFFVNVDPRTERYKGL